ncbi:YbaB/EbfC family nucleoid-associated protein [Helcococcus sueciensis]|uniref:YbaB/EbfC family nucleoid-associated protein n=1 Tax=Helcococcus sueciensis TaxID=241555 RepID=UPI0004124795|nr:YbaB/EbfC family nucleoid-associated protein [Helcococcus sueciensis]
MARRGGFGGGNMNQMMKQVQQMQKKMQDAQQKIEETEYTSSINGGVVEISANGKKEILSIKIDKEIVDPEDVEMLEDMIVTAVNEVIKKVEEDASEKMGALTGGLNIPGMF